MMNVDYIIIGGGYAGLLFAHQLIKNNKSFIIISDGQKSASEISAGVCNPVVLKRFTKVWNAEIQLESVRKTFSDLSNYLGENFIIEESLVRIFHDDKERIEWSKRSKREDLECILDKTFISLDHVENPFDAGQVQHSFRIDVPAFFSSFYEYLEEHQYLIKDSFQYNALDLENRKYKDIVFNNIVFCEGVKVKDNPLFNHLPISGNKGHSLKVKIDGRIDPYIIKKKFFLFNLLDNIYFVGGTYERDQLTNDISAGSVLKLKEGLEEVYNSKYDFIEANAAFRAVVPDRRPILGRHPDYQNVFVFNGMGARGVMNSCYFSDMLYQYIENGSEIITDVHINRYL